mgnify:CR=1 FL=1
MNEFIKKLLFLIPPELAHSLFLEFIKLKLINKNYKSDLLKINLWQKTFHNPLGLAAGFDKNASSIQSLLNLGFGFLELGTVTPLGQKGNKKPRVFRLNEYEAIIQRLGFNNLGIDQFNKNIVNFKKQKIHAILGINIGKNKNTDDFISDYIKLLEQSSPFADYIVLNISSPNTPGLRDFLKQSKISKFIVEIIKRNKHKVPILLKLSPDISENDLENICDICLNKKWLDGLIVSNTTITRNNLNSKPMIDNWKIKETGGLSGPPLFHLSNILLEKTYRLTKGKVPIIGVGGISSANDAYEKIALGASLIQIYTALVYKGPRVVCDILKGMEELLKRDGFKNIKDAIGHKVK